MPLDSAIQKLVSEDTNMRRFSKANTDIAVTLTFSYQNSLQTLVLDTIDDVTVNDSSTLTAHPMVDGTEVADHMYKNPVTMSISGSFQYIDGLASGLLITSEGSELANVQEIFTTLKNEGIKCDIVKLTHQSNTDQIAFKRRSNMVLTSIRWTEKINSLSFAFEFTQAMSAQVMTIEKDSIDENLPNINFPETKDFTETFISWEELDKAVMEAMKTANVLGETFLNVLKSLGSAQLVGLGVTVAVAAVLITVFAATGPIGWLVGAIVGTVIMTVAVSVAIVKAIKSAKLKIKAFKVYKKQEKTDAEIKRFGDVFESIHNIVLSFLQDNVQIYQISSTEDQECMISIANTYYTFGIVKNNTADTYNVKIVDMNDMTIKEGSFSLESVLTDYESCNDKNMFAKIGNEFVHFVGLQENLESLTDVAIVVSKINPSEFWTEFNEMLKKVLYK